MHAAPVQADSRLVSRQACGGTCVPAWNRCTALCMLKQPLLRACLIPSKYVCAITTLNRRALAGIGALMLSAPSAMLAAQPTSENRVRCRKFRLIRHVVYEHALCKVFLSFFNGSEAACISARAKLTQGSVRQSAPACVSLSAFVDLPAPL